MTVYFFSFCQALAPGFAGQGVKGRKAGDGRVEVSALITPPSNSLIASQ